MQMIARVRTVVEVPFDFDILPPDEDGNSPSRAEATDYAVENILPSVVEAASTSGTVLDAMTILEEVREADVA